MRTIELNDADCGLSGFIVLDRPEQPPAFGGTRIAAYPTLDACLEDARRLARAMTLKCITHEIPGSGGKATFMADAITDRPRAIARLGEELESLGGSFYTGPDSGFTDRDVTTLARHTRFVATGDVSTATARGLLAATMAAGTHCGLTISGARVAIQGLGAVGRRLAALLVTRGASVSAADTNEDARKWAMAHDISVLGVTEILSTPCDILIPCALGGTIDSTAANALRCQIVVGAANNVLADDALADVIASRGIVFVPDFVANAGGVISGAWTFLRGTPGTDEEIDRIGDRVRRLLETADARKTAPLRVALEAAAF